jgi:hypothetical protein
MSELGHSLSKPTVKQHLAAVRMLFDWLVNVNVEDDREAFGRNHPVT